MKSNGTILAALAWLVVSSGQVQARPNSQNTSHLSYYTYYRTGSQETVSSVASKFGLAATSLIRMNPVLSQYEEGLLPEGLSVCVPKAKPKAVAEETQKSEAKPKEKVVSKASKSSTKKRKKRRKKRTEREEPSENEWELLAELATEDAPEARSVAEPIAPPPQSRFVGADGRVVIVPSAQPKAKPVKKEKKKKSSRLRSKKGKAIYDVLMTCRSFMGVPYVWGGEHPSGFDCSGYIQYVYGKHGYNLPRTADIQFEVGDRVKRGEELPGDLVFFETYAPGASHVGVYLGRGYFIHASSSRGVTTELLSTPFFAERYLGARRNI